MIYVIRGGEWIKVGYSKDAEGVQERLSTFQERMRCLVGGSL